MGTTYSYYMFLGVNVPKNERASLSNVDEAYWGVGGIGQRNEDKFDILIDRMGEDYFLIGVKLWKETMYMDGDGFKEIETMEFPQLILDAIEDFKKHYPEHSNVVLPSKWRLYAVPYAS